MNETLVEQVVGAWRPQTPEGDLRPHHAWHDLSEDERRVAFAESVRQRSIEAALDAEGLSTTSHAVLARIRAR